MPTRRSFISAAAAVTAAGIAQLGDAPASEAAPKGPSPAALALAKSLQQTLPGAHLSDELVEKIAKDIDGYAPVAKDFRKIRLRNWDEPDFVFIAEPVVPRR
jgi:hypothetical protein